MSGRKVAVKRLKGETKKERQRVLLEGSLLSHAACAYVVDFYGCYIVDAEIWIVMEYIQGWEWRKGERREEKGERREERGEGLMEGFGKIVGEKVNG